MTSKTAFVTGAAGFLGRHLVTRLRDEDAPDWPRGEGYRILVEGEPHLRVERRVEGALGGVHRPVETEGRQHHEGGDRHHGGERLQVLVGDATGFPEDRERKRAQGIQAWVGHGFAGDEGGIDIDLRKIVDDDRQLAPLPVREQVVK